MRHLKKITCIVLAGLACLFGTVCKLAAHQAHRTSGLSSASSHQMTLPEESTHFQESQSVRSTDENEHVLRHEHLSLPEETKRFDKAPRKHRNSELQNVDLHHHQFDVDNSSHRRTYHRLSRHTAVDFVKVGDLYVFACNVDLRSPGSAIVRVLALKHKEHNDSLEMAVGQARHVIQDTRADKMGEGHGKEFEGWMFSFVLSNTFPTLPDEILVRPHGSRKPAHTQSWVSLSPRTIPSQTQEEIGMIGVCVPPLFGKVKLASILTFVVMCKVFGADMVFLYIENVSPEVAQLLYAYSEKHGSVTLVAWNIPGNVTDWDNKIWYHGQVLAIQDCLYRNMASFRFLLFMDLDEMLVPRGDMRDWPEMLARIFTTHDQHKVAALSFSTVFFDPTRPPDNSDPITYFRYLRRTKASSKVRYKLMVQPLKVLELGIHHMSRAVSEEFSTVAVSERLALLHHYRQCSNAFDPYMKCYPTRQDRTMLPYKEKLAERLRNPQTKSKVNDGRV